MRDLPNAIVNRGDSRPATSTHVVGARSANRVQWLVLAAFILGCGPKGADYFGPVSIHGVVLVDITSPVVNNVWPNRPLVLRSSRVRFDAFDLRGAVGEPVSGTNFPRFTARSSLGALLPISRDTAPNRYFIDIATLGQGQNTISLATFDSAGNQSNTSIGFILDTQPATVSVNVPASTVTTTASHVVNVTGSIGNEPNGLSAAEITLRHPENNECTPNGALYQVGTSPGAVSQNRFDLGLTGQFGFAFTTHGPANSQRPSASTLCLIALIRDQALDKYGDPRPNVTIRSIRQENSWIQLPPVGTIAGRVTADDSIPLAGVTVTTTNGRTTTTGADGRYSFALLGVGDHVVTITAPPGHDCNPISKTDTVRDNQTTTVDFNCRTFNFQLTVEVVWVHVAPGVSYACARLRITEIFGSLVGATWVANWTGPGVVGPTQRTGTFVNNQALDRQPINLFGTYTANVSATANGVTKTATGSATVGGTQSTCTPP